MPLNSSIRENGAMIITSGDRLTIDTAADFSRVVLEALDASHSTAIEFEPEVAIDLTGVQIICSACRSAAEAGKTFLFHGPQPHALADIISACGGERHAHCKHNNDSNCIWFGGGN